MCFGILKWLARLWKGFETETKKLEKIKKSKDKLTTYFPNEALRGYFKQLEEIQKFRRCQLCLFILLL